MNQLDEMILNAPHKALLTPICAKEVLVLRTIGLRWQGVTGQVVSAHQELMAIEGGFGPIDFKLYVGRKYSEGSIIKTAVQEIAIPQEFFTWPL